MNDAENLIAATGTDQGASQEFLLSVAVKRGAVTFDQADLTGEWWGHALASGDYPNTPRWERFKCTANAAGVLNIFAFIDSTGNTIPGNPGALTVNANGAWSFANVPSSNGVMNDDKNLLVMTFTDGAGFTLLLMQKRDSTTYKTSDLEGLWHTHQVVSGDAPAVLGWARLKGNINGSGTYTITNYEDSQGGTTGSTTVPLAITSEGTVTVPTSSFVGSMGNNKDLVIGAEDSSSGGHKLSVMVLKKALGAAGVWTRIGDRPVLPVTSDEWDETSVAAPMVLMEKDKYKMYYTGRSQPLGDISQIGLAESKDGYTWTKHSGNPVISAGSSGWNSEGVARAAVIQTGTGYEAWVGGTADGAQWSIGYYKSTDGVAWTEPVTNPLPSLAPTDPWEGNLVLPGSVIKDGDLYRMWYVGRNAIGRWAVGYATSSDGINWTKYLGNPVFRRSTNSWEDEGPRSCSVVFDGRDYYMMYAAQGDKIMIGSAQSSDGLTWTRGAQNPEFQPRTGWESSLVRTPCLLFEDGRRRLYYAGTNNQDYFTALQIGLAEYDTPPRAQVDFTRTVPASETVEGYRMYCGVVEDGAADKADLMADAIPQYDPTLMRIGFWNSLRQKYIEYPDWGANEPDFGHSFWALFAEGHTFNESGQRNYAQSGPLGLCWAVIELQPGWNQVGLPFPDVIADVDGMIVCSDQTCRRLTGAGNNLTQHVWWRYNKGVYEAAHRIAPSEGGWIKNVTLKKVDLGIPVTSASFTPLASDRASTDGLERPPAPPGADLAESGSGGGGGGGCFIGTLAGGRP